MVTIDLYIQLAFVQRYLVKSSMQLCIKIVLTDGRTDVDLSAVRES